MREIEAQRDCTKEKEQGDEEVERDRRSCVCAGISCFTTNGTTEPRHSPQREHQQSDSKSGDREWQPMRAGKARPKGDDDDPDDPGTNRHRPDGAGQLAKPAVAGASHDGGEQDGEHESQKRGGNEIDYKHVRRPGGFSTDATAVSARNVAAGFQQHYNSVIRGWQRARIASSGPVQPAAQRSAGANREEFSAIRDEKRGIAAFRLRQNLSHV